MAMIAGALVGGINGIIPLLIGINRKKPWIGVFALIVCIPFGVIAVAFWGAMLLTPIFACALALVIFLVYKNK